MRAGYFAAQAQAQAPATSPAGTNALPVIVAPPAGSPWRGRIGLASQIAHRWVPRADGFPAPRPIYTLETD